MKLLKKFISYYKPHKLIFALDMTASFLVAAIGMGYPVLTRMVLNDFVPNKNILWIILSGVILLAIYCIRMVLRWFIQYYGHVMGVRMQAQMRSDMFIKLQKLPYTYYDENETGKIMSRMTNDLFEISELAHHGPENIFIASFTLLGALGYLMSINWILGLICFAMVPLLFFVSFIYRKKMKIAFTESRKAVAQINASLESSISGIRVTKAYTNEETEEEKFEQSNGEFLKARKIAYSAMSKYFASSQFITDVFNVVLLVGGAFFIYAGYIPLEDYSVFIISVNLFIGPVNQLIQFMESYQNASTGFKRFVEILEEDEEIDTGTHVLTNPLGKISFENVDFHYKSSKGILNNISFDIEPGKRIALVGPTGGGKTTICHLIPKFYNITSGSIKIDDISIDEITLNSLRSNIGIVQQDVFLFNGSIKDNILYGNRNATNEEIIAASKKANIYDFIMSLEDGFDSQIGERGVKLSGGQKQRLSIARAFLKNPKILILDEATSALDNTTEMLIQASLNELCKGRTTIVVAHRLSTIKNVDEIFVISNGDIIERGNHETLIKKDESIYKTLYELQFKTLDEEDNEKLNAGMPIMS